jgi:hypothetical protein
MIPITLRGKGACATFDTRRSAYGDTPVPRLETVGIVGIIQNLPR